MELKLKKPFTKHIKAKDLKTGMNTEFGKLVAVEYKGEVILLETKLMQFDIRRNKLVVVYV